MDDPAGFWGLLKNGLAILNSYKAIIDYGPKLLGLGSGLVKRRWYDIDELFPNLMEGKLSLGDIVECSGFLSKYSQTFLPMSYAPLVSGPSSEKVLLRKIENGRVTEKRQLTTIANALQIPIKVIPSSGNIKLCFLYSDARVVKGRTLSPSFSSQKGSVPHCVNRLKSIGAFLLTYEMRAFLLNGIFYKLMLYPYK